MVTTRLGQRVMLGIRREDEEGADHASACPHILHDTPATLSTFSPTYFALSLSLSLSLSSLSPRDPIFSDDSHRGRRKRRRTSSTLREMYTAQGREAWRQGKEGRVKGKGRAGHVRSASKNEPPAGRPDLLLEELK